MRKRRESDRKFREVMGDESRLNLSPKFSNRIRRCMADRACSLRLLPPSHNGGMRPAYKKCQEVLPVSVTFTGILVSLNGVFR